MLSWHPLTPWERLNRQGCLESPSNAVLGADFNCAEACMHTLHAYIYHSLVMPKQACLKLGQGFAARTVYLLSLRQGLSVGVALQGRTAEDARPADT